MIGDRGEERAYIRAAGQIDVIDRVRLRSLNDLLDRHRDHCRLFCELTALEQHERIAGEIRSFAAEVNGAYLDQRTYGRNFKLSADDVTALWSIAEWAEYDLELVRWRSRDAENDAAWQLFERAPESLTTTAKARLDTAPKRPARPKSPPPPGCPAMPTRDEPAMWDELLGDFLRTRRGNRFQGDTDDHE